MTTSAKPKFERVYPAILAVEADRDKVTVNLSDGRIVSAPTAWFPRLVGAPESVLKVYEISPSGYGIHWPKLDEDVSIKAFLEGIEKPG